MEEPRTDERGSRDQDCEMKLAFGRAGMYT